MPTSRRDLRDDEVIRFLRYSVTESAAATYTQDSYDTNLSIHTGLIWMIHWIEMNLSPSSVDDPAQDASEWIKCQITRESKAAMVYLDNTDLIAIAALVKDRSATIGTAAGPDTYMGSEHVMIKFPIPIPYAAQNIYIAAQSTSAAAVTIRGRVAYTLRKVSDKFFYRVAQALIS